MSYPDLADLDRVNAECNLLPYKSDQKLFGKLDDWTPGDERGSDCESYAMAKFSRLFLLGWSPQDLRLACCYIEPAAAPDLKDRYHGVLVVHLPDGSERGLDNRYPGVLRLEEWERIGYVPDIIQMRRWPRSQWDWEAWRWSAMPERALTE